MGEILAARRISVFGHIAWFESDVPAHMALRWHIDMSVGRPPGPDWRRRPGIPRARWTDQIRRDSSSSPVEFWRRADHHGYATGGMQGPRRLRNIDDDDDDDDNDDENVKDLKSRDRPIVVFKRLTLL